MFLYDTLPAVKRSTKVIIVTAALALILLGTATYATFTLKPHAEAPKAPQSVTTPTISQLLADVNQERAKNGVAPLKEDSRLDASAQFKADDELKYNYFGHVSPHDGEHGYEYINDTGIVCKTDSENLVGAVSANEGIQWWRNSAPHYAAMIDADYSLTGFGIVHVKDIPIDRIKASEPATSDIVDEYLLVEHFCQQ